MKAFLGLEKKMVFEKKKIDFEIDSSGDIYDVTEQVYELIELLHFLLSVSKDSNLMRYGLLKFEAYLKELKEKSLSG